MKTILDYIALGMARAFAWLISVLPERAAFNLAKGLVHMLLFCMPRTKRVAERNLAIAFPEKSVAERRAIAAKSYDVLAQNLMGFARIPSLTVDDVGKAFDRYAGPLKVLQSARSAGDGVGVLVPTIHFGASEIFVQAHAMFAGPINILARPFGLPRLDQWWNDRRENFGNHVFSRKGGYREIIRRLREGQDVTLLCDQNVKANYATFVNFFGLPAAMTKTVGIAALRTGAPVIFAVCFRSAADKFTVFTDVIPNPQDESGTVDEKIAKFTQRLSDCIERVIREHPEQWFWIHRRWKTRPPGEPETIYQ